MLKLFGALLIVIAGTLIGRLQAKKLADRPGQIRRFVRILDQLETEISYGYTPLPQAFAKMGKQTSQPFASLLIQIGERLEKEESTVMEVWRDTLRSNWHQLALRGAEQEIIVQIGNTLGTSDRENQMKHLRLAAKQLEGIEIEATEEQRKYEKMWKSLGLLSGALIAVIMY